MAEFMKITPIAQSYIKNNQSLLTPKVSFGEYDGDFYDFSQPKMTKEQFEAKKASINEKYNNLRSAWLTDCDDLGISSSVAWMKLGQIEKLRYRDLSALQREYEL